MSIFSFIFPIFFIAIKSYDVCFFDLFSNYLSKQLNIKVKYRNGKWKKPSIPTRVGKKLNAWLWCTGYLHLIIRLMTSGPRFQALRQGQYGHIMKHVFIFRKLSFLLPKLWEINWMHDYGVHKALCLNCKNRREFRPLAKASMATK